MKAVGQGAFGAGMDFNNQTICTHRDCRTGNGGNETLLASSVGWIGDHGQVRKIASQGHGGEVEGIAHFAFEGLDAALAQDNIPITAGQ